MEEYWQKWLFETNEETMVCMRKYFKKTVFDQLLVVFLLRITSCLFYQYIIRVANGSYKSHDLKLCCYRNLRILCCFHVDTLPKVHIWTYNIHTQKNGPNCHKFTELFRCTRFLEFTDDLRNRDIRVFWLHLSETSPTLCFAWLFFDYLQEVHQHWVLSYQQQVASLSSSSHHNNNSTSTQITWMG